MNHQGKHSAPAADDINFIYLGILHPLIYLLAFNDHFSSRICT